MKRKMVLRMAGILALCLLIGSMLSGALGAEEEQTPTPQLQVLVGGDVVFESLAEQIDQLEKTPKNRIPSVDWVEDLTPLLTVTETLPDGKVLIIADIFIDPQWLGEYLRPLPIDPHFIGLVRAYEPFALRCKGEFEEGDYYVWMADADELGIELPIEIELHWFMALVDPDGEIVAILYFPDDEFRPPEEMLMATDHPIISLLSSCQVPEPETEPPEPPPPIPPPVD